jgi:hypothetical protein
MDAGGVVASALAVGNASRAFANALPMTIRHVVGTHYAGSTRVVSKVQR